MLHKLSFALLLAVLTCGQIASAQITQSGKCLEVKLPDKFNWTAIEGVWYEYARYRNSLEDEDECVHNNFEAINDTIAIKYSSVDASNKLGTYDLDGKILGPGVFFITIDENGGKQTNKIIGTDYISWAFIYTCENIGDQHAEVAWIHTRERNPNEETVAEAMAALKQNGVSTKYLINTRQNGCLAHIK